MTANAPAEAPIPAEPVAAVESVPAPAESTPVEAAPAESAPVEAVPAPVDTAPADAEATLDAVAPEIDTAATNAETHVVEVPGPISYFYDHHALAGMDHATFIRWGLVALVWLMAALWHQHQNKAFHEYIRNTNARTKLNDRLSHLAYNRAFEVMGVFFVLILVLIFYDTRIFKAESDLETARKALQLQTTELNTLSTDTTLLRNQLDGAFDRISSGIDDDKESLLDDLKAKYEGLFVSYYYLKRCNALSKTEFHLLNSALIQELTDMNARAGVRKRILEAAKGTHDELYAQAPCTPDAIDPKKKEIDDYLRQVIDNLPDQ